MQSEKAKSCERIRSVSCESKVPIECYFSFIESLTTKDIFNWNIGSFKESLINCLLSCSFVKCPSFSCIIYWEYHLSVIKYFLHNGQFLGNSKISIKSFNIVLILIETISIEYFRYLLTDNSTSLINSKIYQERVEIASGNNNLSQPIIKSFVIILFIDCDSCEESHIWKWNV